VSIFDQPIILIIIAIVTVLRWLSQRSNTTKDDPERPKVPDEPIPRGSESQSEEERIRRFLEALGQPTRSTPPPKVTRRVTVTKREVLPRGRPFGSPLPPITTTPPPLETKPPPFPTFSPGPVQVFPPPPPVPTEQPITKPATTVERSFGVHDLSVQNSSATSSTDDYRAVTTRRASFLSLGSSQDLRRAIVLREIFGPPRGLQQVEIGF